METFGWDGSRSDYRYTEAVSEVVRKQGGNVRKHIAFARVDDTALRSEHFVGFSYGIKRFSARQSG